MAIASVSNVNKIIDNARDILVGKIPNPQSQIEQITIAMIYKFMDDMDLDSIEIGGQREFFTGDLEKYAWSKIMSSQLGAQARSDLYIEALEKLPLASNIPQLFRNIFKGAYLPFRDGQTLTMFLKEINEIKYDNSENLGNAFEYLLSIMGSQGDAGQFRTPRHIIDFIVDIVKPTKNDTILDPACGTAGFLISAFQYITKNAKNNNQILTPAERKALTENIQGYDISPDMVKLALVNMYLHKFKEPKIFEYDTLTKLDRWDNYFDCILANPPFMTPKGGIQPHNRFGVKANKSEVLFVDYIMEHLNSTGRAGIIVPEGIVFQSANAYKQLRKKLVDENYLYGVVSLPSGIFQPYSGVKTSILLIDKQLAKKTDKILFVEIKNDGFDLGAQRRPIDKNDLPQALELINKWKESIYRHCEEQSDEAISNDKDCFTTFAMTVEKSKIAENEEYNLTSSRYKETKDYTNCKWEMVKLGDVCEFIGGYAFKSTNLKDIKTSETELPVIKIGNIKKNGSLDITNVQYHDSYNLNKYLIFKNDIIIAMTGATVGKVACSIYNNLLLNQRNGLIRATEKVNSNYIKHLLLSNSFYQFCQDMAGGGAQGNISPQQILNYEIPLPPLEVQEEIVKELDSYQAIIDGAQKVIDNYKPTIPINPTWQKVKLGEVCNVARGSSPRPIQDYLTDDSDGLNWLKIGDINENEKYIYKTSEKIKKEGLSKTRLVKENDFILSNSMSFGRPYIMKISACIHDGWLTLQNISSKINKLFLYYLLSSDFVKMQFLKYAVGSTVKNLKSNTVAMVDIFLPSLEEQNQIVEEIEKEEQMVENCKQLVELYKQKINTKIQSIWGEE